MNIRPVNPATDVGAVAQLISDEFCRYPELKPDKARFYSALKELSHKKTHYARVATDEAGTPVACLLSVTNQNIWAQRNNCQVTAWVSRRPGAGAALLHDFVQWVRGYRSIRLAGFMIDCEVDPRALRLIQRFGFEQRGGALLLVN
jgi:hypothetical protein